MGLPIILGVEGEAKELLARMRAGIAITPGSADDLLRAIDRLRSDRRLREQFSEAGLAYARAWFERDLLARDMLDEVRKVR